MENHRILITGSFAQRIMFYISLFLIIFFAWKLQDKLFFNWDVGTLILATRKLLNHGKYITDFFTPNPPFILYLYTPAVIVSNILNQSVIIIFRIYIFIIALASLLLCQIILKKYQSKDNFPYYSFLLMVAIVFLIFPFFNLGQRDHLAAILTLPYMLLTARRLDYHTPRTRVLIAVGLLAGLGFAIKPHFLISFVMIEIYYAVHQKSFRKWLRMESAIVFLILCLYLMSLFIFHQEYIFRVAPYLYHHYYTSSLKTWTGLILNLASISFFIPIYLFLVQKTLQQYKYLRLILFIGFIGFIVSFFSQRSGYYYHLIPALSLEFLLIVLQLAIFKQQINFANKFVNNLSLIAITLLIYTLPVYSQYCIYKFGINYRHDMLDNLVAFIQTQPPHQSLLVLSTSTMFGFPLNDLTNTAISQRYDSLWMLDQLTKQHRKGEQKKIMVNIENNRYFFLKMLIADIQKNKPSLIFVERKITPEEIYDDPAILSKNLLFRKEWQNYYHLTDIKFGRIKIYIDVYKRKPTS